MLPQSEVGPGYFAISEYFSALYFLYTAGSDEFGALCRE